MKKILFIVCAFLLGSLMSADASSIGFASFGPEERLEITTVYMVNTPLDPEGVGIIEGGIVGGDECPGFADAYNHNTYLLSKCEDFVPFSAELLNYLHSNGHLNGILNPEMLNPEMIDILQKKTATQAEAIPMLSVEVLALLLDQNLGEYHPGQGSDHSSSFDR
jgi:hypothetical protein